MKNKNFYFVEIRTVRVKEMINYFEIYRNFTVPIFDSEHDNKDVYTYLTKKSANEYINLYRLSCDEGFYEINGEMFCTFISIGEGMSKEEADYCLLTHISDSMMMVAFSLANDLGIGKRIAYYC